MQISKQTVAKINAAWAERRLARRQLAVATATAIVKRHEGNAELLIAAIADAIVKGVK
jgi:hypothetical protein